MRRNLSGEEVALWAQLAGTVAPLQGRVRPQQVPSAPPGRLRLRQSDTVVLPTITAPSGRAREDLRTRPQTLDASWDRKLSQGVVSPDFTLDLHGHSLDAAHARLDHGLTLALAQGARLVLVITGLSRPSDGNSGRGESRGAIRAKFLDWLSNGSHSSRIAAIRPAHPRHGGAGAVYVVLRRAR
jgi:DNA-nicking Smr family endonuclease